MGEHGGFIEKLQSLDGPAKNKILIVATAVAMVIIVYFWLAYFNNLIAGVTQPAPIPVTESTAQPSAVQAQPSAPGDNSGGVSIWSNFKNAASFMYGEFVRAVHGLSNAVQAPKQYIVNPPQ